MRTERAPSRFGFSGAARRRATWLRLPLGGVAGTILAIGAASASAQTAFPVIQPTIPYTYDQDRNVSVAEQPRPDFDPLGIRIGGFLAYPTLNLGVAASNNVYISPDNKTADAFAIISPGIATTSDWSRHQLRLSANGAFRRYLDQTPLDRNEYDIRSLGRLDVGDYGNLTGEAQLSRLREEPFTSQLDAPLATLSSYQRIYATARGERQIGRTRLTLAADLTNYDFSPIRFADGSRRSQIDRNRNIATVAGQFEYARTPGAVLFAQLLYSKSDYDRNLLLTGSPNRDSSSQRVIAGVNLDLPGFVRGTVGVGYSRRDFDAATYKTVSGLSLQAELTYFFSALTNFRLAAHRVIDDSAIADNSAFFDTQLSAGVDHELRRNIILGATARHGVQNYFDSPLRYKIYRIDGNVRYLLSRKVRLQLDAGYGKRDRVGLGAKQVFDEATGRLTLGLQI